MFALLLLLSACGAPGERASPTAPPSAAVSPSVTPDAAESPGTPVVPYDDLRDQSMQWGGKHLVQEGRYNREDIFTYTFNEGTILEGNEDLQAETMEAGKDPGLGIRALHAQGITGEGVRVAIIDQNLLLDHPEFSGKIAAYYDTGCEVPADVGSMHAPAVTSILVGEHIGVAPGAEVYFAAAPSWTGDSAYYADGLDWIIAENRKLPAGEKIRVVSVSAAPSGAGSLFTEHLEQWDAAVARAKAEGILVLDCRDDAETGFIAPAYFDPDYRQDPTKCAGGFPPKSFVLAASYVGVPTSYRTVAEEYMEGAPSYQYTGRGGLSWGIPYAAGVLALGWQENPDLDGAQMVQILFDTCAAGENGSKIIDPAAFIAAVQAEKQ